MSDTPGRHNLQSRTPAAAPSSRGSTGVAAATHFAVAARYSVCDVYVETPGAVDDKPRFFWVAIPEDPSHEIVPVSGEADTFAEAVAAASAVYPGSYFAGSVQAADWLCRKDPLTELGHALSGHGKPPLWWVVKWSEGGREPFAAAWDASSDIDAMVKFAWTQPGGKRLIAAIIKAGGHVQLVANGASVGLCTVDDRTALVKTIKSCGVVLPTLAQVVEMHGRRGAVLVEMAEDPTDEVPLETRSVRDRLEALVGQMTSRPIVEIMPKVFAMRGEVSEMTSDDVPLMLEMIDSLKEMTDVQDGGTQSMMGAAFLRVSKAMQAISEFEKTKDPNTFAV